MEAGRPAVEEVCTVVKFVDEAERSSLWARCSDMAERIWVVAPARLALLPMWSLFLGSADSSSELSLSSLTPMAVSRLVLAPRRVRSALTDLRTLAGSCLA